MSGRSQDQQVALVQDLLALPHETEWVEDKANNSEPEMIGQYISALANSAALAGQSRGYVIWGVQDKSRKVVGTTFSPSGVKVGNEDISNWLVRLLDPQIHFQFHDLVVDGARIVLLEIDAARFKPVSFKREEYIRVGSYKKKLRDHPEHARRLWRSFDASSFEEGVASGLLEATEVLKVIDYPAYFDLMEMPLPENRSQIIKVLESDSIIMRAGPGIWNITNLGGMLFAKHLKYFPSLRRKTVRVVLYRGISRVETVSEQVGVQGYASGFGGLVSYINGLLPSNEVIGQALRQTVKMYPELAVRELVANALIHQDFSLTGTGPMIEIFDDRIEITNPGTPLVDPDRFIDSPPRSRNERLATVMRRARICEERGSGWDKIAFEIDFHQLPAPLVEVTLQHTRVTLFSHRSLGEMDREARVRAVYLHACLRHVTRQTTTNTSIRERFGIESRNSARASRLIREAVDAGFVVPRDPDAPRKLMEYVPSWAAPESRDGTE